MIQILENNKEKPICPHCERELDNLFFQRLTSFFGVRFIYFCSGCKKVIGVSQRKGFWMG